MSLLDSFVYGVIQGLTEFLPVSSSGHLALLPKLLEIKDPGVFFDLSMHVGTALAVLVYFWKDCKKILFSLTSCYSQNFIFSTFITVILALLLKPIAETYGRTPEFIAFNLTFFALFMMYADKVGRENKEMTGKRDLLASGLIGFFQALALFPGVSRSGITLTISRFLGISRLEASRYSFLLSLPLILGGFLLKLVESFKSPIAFSLKESLFGFSISFIIGILTIHFFLRAIQKLGLSVFGFYRIILSAMIWYFLIL